MSQRMIIAGNSHAGALREGMDVLVERGQLKRLPDQGDREIWAFGDESVEVVGIGSGRYELAPFSEVRYGQVRLLGPTARRLKLRTGLGYIDPSVTWGFVNVANTARIFAHPMWRDFAPSALESIEDRTPLTESVVRRILLADHAPVRAFYEQLLEHNVRAIAIEGPRPQASHEALLDDTDRRVALYLDRLGRSMWHEWFDNKGISYVEPPEDTYGPDGFLLPELRRIARIKNGQVDHNHGNGEYGSRILPAILAAMSELSVDATA